ncbi:MULTISPECIES: hypothetical protein [Actinomyces]|uniref:Lipoprotein n=1 Tax=Actinomyces respiraculi TaxID=2744574 RepID=A0A7T0PWN6_9ACTO|nr:MULTISPECIES: hypothetical protein [Actinomyces]QPL05015.1 hypothetical protein ID810_09740 [Actinomyces respiraculi]
MTGLERRGASRRAVLAVGALTLAAGCAPGGSDDVLAGGAGAVAAVTPAGTSLDAPELVLLPWGDEATGETVEPLTGVRLVLAPRARALTPEWVADGRVQVTYVWTDTGNWGYLVLEGPGSFPVTGGNDAMAAAHAEEQLLIGELIRPRPPETTAWTGMAQSVQMSWNQATTPPGWSEETSVDAEALFVVDGAGHSYTAVVYGARDLLVSANPAVTTLCSLTVSEPAS